MNYTPEQAAAIQARGKIIVSASAGSGKTFVMIQKLCDFLQGGGDLDTVLAVTFTKKAAAQIKEKLRKTLISRLASCGEGERASIKAQLAKIPSADISTIHSFCARLIRTHFYALGIDRSFEIVVDDARLSELRSRAMDNLFDRLYDGGDPSFLLVLDCLRRRRSDDNVRKLLSAAYEQVRNVAGYRQRLGEINSLWTEEGFNGVCADFSSLISSKCSVLKSALDGFFTRNQIPPSLNKIKDISGEIYACLDAAVSGDLFEPLPAYPSTRRPSGKTAEEKQLSEAFGELKADIKKRYDGLKKNLSDRQTEYAAFLKSGELARAFSDVLLQFDGEYAAVKREENVLDPADLEHLTLELLSDSAVREEVNARYKNVFVDEYQDVNPVQEAIINLVGAEEVFTVGDVKQAIYGFRGSKSVFFSKKFTDMQKSDGALKLSVNFRSSDGVLYFVNALFGSVMTDETCGIDYKNDGVMHRGGKYPEGYGSAKIIVFGKDESPSPQAAGVYSVLGHKVTRTGHTREGLAVVELVRRELASMHYSIEEGKMVPARPGDICILTRKNASDSTLGIVRALTDAGYGVEGAGDGDLLVRGEIVQLLDILSLIDNCQQDIPLATAMLSPVGGFTCDELAAIRISQNGAPRMTFRDCLVNYRKYKNDALTRKIASFFKKINDYRRLSDILGAASLIDKILSDSGLAARYASDGGAKLSAVRRLQQEAYSGGGELSLSAFLARIKRLPSLKSSVPASPDSVKVVTMHSSKGLEYPVVILADIALSFTGERSNELPFDDKYGFAPRAYDVGQKLMRTTILRELCAARARSEDIKNELNLFYVACTRAMCNLYVLVGEKPKYDPVARLDADCYAKMFNIDDYSPEYMEELTDFTGVSAPLNVAGGGEDVDLSLMNARYSGAESCNLAVKTSASQLMRAYEGEEKTARHYLFGDEYEDLPSGREAGTAYHRFLELCDFSVTDGEGVSAEINRMTEEGTLSAEQAELLSAERLSKILKMPAFEAVRGARIFREQEFLCTLPACELFETSARDGVLVQGAIDLLAVGADGVRIIDYKFVKLDEDGIRKKYTRQLELYKSAVSLIMGVDKGTIKASIIDLRRLVQINV